MNIEINSGNHVVAHLNGATIACKTPVNTETSAFPGNCGAILSGGLGISEYYALRVHGAPVPKTASIIGRTTSMYRLCHTLVGAKGTEDLYLYQKTRVVFALNLMYYLFTLACRGSQNMVVITDNTITGYTFKYNRMVELLQLSKTDTVFNQNSSNRIFAAVIDLTKLNDYMDLLIKEIKAATGYKSVSVKFTSNGFPITRDGRTFTRGLDSHGAVIDENDSDDDDEDDQIAWE